MNKWPYPVISAHRGGGIFAPENTLAAMRYGYAQGFKGVEFDVMVSNDQVPILMHDPELGRTVSGEGQISDYTAAQLQKMDAGSWHSASYTGEPIPLFDEIVNYCKQHGMWMNVEIKPVPTYDIITACIVAEHLQQIYAKELTIPDQHIHLPLLSSFSVEAMQELHHVAAAFPRAMLYDKVPEDWHTQLQQLDCVSLHCNHRHLNAAMVDAIHQAGYWVFVYTVNDPERARELLTWGVDGMVTDQLDLIPANFS